jgi:DNA-binding NtrC family response regulator
VNGPSPLPSQPPWVVVLEDDVAFRHVLVEFLEVEGLRVTTCDTYAGLRRKLRKKGPIVVVADFWGTSHVELSSGERAEIRELGLRAPTVLLTARSWAPSASACDLNLVSLLPKPVVLDELITQVRRCLDVTGLRPSRAGPEIRIETCRRPGGSDLRRS